MRGRELEVAGAGAWGCGRDGHACEDFSRLNVGLIVVDEEVFDRQDALATGRGQDCGRAEGYEGGGRVLVGVAMHQPAADGGHVANPGRGDADEGVGDQGQGLGDSGVGLDAPLGAEGADAHRAMSAVFVLA